MDYFYKKATFPLFFISFEFKYSHLPVRVLQKSILHVRYLISRERKR